MNESTSYRQILRSTTIIGGASIARVVIGLIRTKIAAMLLGPIGLGMIGVFQNLVDTASAVAGFGLGTVGARKIAEAAGRNDEEGVVSTRKVLALGVLITATIGTIACFLFRGLLAKQVAGDPSVATQIGYLSIGVAMTIASGWQSAFLTGMRKVGDIARISVLSALVSTTIGLSALMIWGFAGVAAFIISAPLASFLIGHFYVRKLTSTQKADIPWRRATHQLPALLQSGAVYMIASMAVPLGLLIVRMILNAKLGPEALGQFQAVWAISMTYISFVLTAMGTDYYPRLAASMHDHSTVNRLVNDQSEVVLLLSAPVFLISIAFSPLALELLYTKDFISASSVLRWQILGDVLKIASWPIGFILLAAGNTIVFMLCESGFIAIYVLITWLILPIFGIKSVGIAFFVMYLLYLPTAYILAQRRTGFAWNPRVLRLFPSLLTAMTIVATLSEWSEKASAVVGSLLTLVFAIYAAARLETTAKLVLLPASWLAFFRRLVQPRRPE